MSSLSVDNLKTLSGNGIDAQIKSIGGGHLSNRNKIINGAMMISQRATSKTDVAAGYHTVDRMRMSKNSLSTAEITHEQSTDSPNGFGKSLKTTITTAEGSVAAEDAFRPLQYRIEGQDLQDLAYGTSDAKSLTLSFHVKSSVTGTYSLSFRNITAGTYRLRSTTYTIDSANTWEKKIITIAGDTSTAIINDNAARFEIYWCGGSGTNFTSSNVAASGWADYVSGGLHHGHTVQLQNTLNSTFLLTGIQLEVGDTATLFEHRSFTEELTRCYRYYRRFGANSALPTPAPYNRFSIGYSPSSSDVRFPFQLDPPMRIKPVNSNFSKSGNFSIQPGSIGSYTLTCDDNSCSANMMIALMGSTSVSSGAGSAVSLHANNDTTAYIEISAEL